MFDIDKITEMQNAKLKINGIDKIKFVQFKKIKHRRTVCVIEDVEPIE